jgi:AhpD family alkylhydroperoxidase
VKYVRAVPVEQATGLVATVYGKVAEDFHITAPLVLHSPVPDLLAGVWMVLRETLITGRVAREHKEAVATGVSQANTCPYCIAAHAMMRGGAGQSEAGEALLRGGTAEIGHPVLRSLAVWGSRSLTPDDALVQAPPFAPSDVVELVGTAVAFHYINRMVNVFLPESPMPWLLRRFGAVPRRFLAATFGRRMVTRTPRAGTSLSLLPEAQLPQDFAWAAGNHAVANAFARAAAAVDEAGRAALPDSVRMLVARGLTVWRGASPTLGRAWVADAVAPLNAADQPLAAFCLLTALASYRVDRTIVEEFRARRPTDADLVGAAAWAAFSAARRVGSWLGSAKIEA